MQVAPKTPLLYNIIMDVNEVYEAYIAKEGPQLVKDDIVQLWSYTQHMGEEAMLELIEEMAAKYEDPIVAEIGFISIWNHIVRG